MFGKSVLVLGLGLLAIGCDGTSDSKDPLGGLKVISEDSSTRPIVGLSTEWMTRFREGDALFEKVFVHSNGLGPIYIRHACASCHADDAKGPGAVRKQVVVAEDGITMAADQSPLPFGHTIRPQFSGTATVGIDVVQNVPSLKVSTRFSPAVFGRGYLEAILDSEIERIEAEQSQRTDGISGRINRVPYQSHGYADQPFHSHELGSAGLIGRFGLKGRIATLDDFTADAFQGDMGITSPLRPEELPKPTPAEDGKDGIDLDADAVNRVADYVRTLAIPERRNPDELGAPGALDADASLTDTEGAHLFEAVQCSVCHVPALRTDPQYPIPQLAGILAPVYTDLLLHDMGDDLADGLKEFSASEREWRTPPLIGLRFLKNYLHDGRAQTVEEAILEHKGAGSEANDSIERFEALTEAERMALVRFVSAL